MRGCHTEPGEHDQTCIEPIPWQVLELAADYRRLTDFILCQEQGGEGGMYLEALCQGLDQVLEPYRSGLAPGVGHCYCQDNSGPPGAGGAAGP